MADVDFDPLDYDSYEPYWGPWYDWDVKLGLSYPGDPMDIIEIEDIDGDILIYHAGSDNIVWNGTSGVWYVKRYRILSVSWSEWMKHDGSSNCPIEDGSIYQIQKHSSPEVPRLPIGQYDLMPSHWKWRTITQYRIGTLVIPGSISQDDPSDLDRFRKFFSTNPVL